MGKAVGRPYLITRRCFYMVAQPGGVHEQEIFFSLGSFGSRRRCGL